MKLPSTVTPPPPLTLAPGQTLDVLFTGEELQQRIGEMGAAISRDYRGRDLLLVGILKGVFVFMSDLLRAIDLPAEVDFMAISRFHPGDRRGVRLLKDLNVPIEGRPVLLVEDIVDTGLTLHYLLRSLSVRHPASLQVCVLLDRPRRRLVDLPIAYRGFDLGDSYVVGYGLDYRQQGRNLAYIAEVRGTKRGKDPD